MAPKRKAASTSSKKEQAPAVEDTTTTKDEPAAAAAASPSKKAKTTAAGGKLAVGGNVSSVSVTLTTEEEKEVTLADITKANGAVIFMYPKANTGGCTKQACGFKDHHKDITAKGFEVYGLSFDKPKSQTNWKTNYSLPYHLLTDPDGTALKAFGAFKAPKNIIRSHVVIGKGGQVLDIKNQISPGDSFAEATAFVKKQK